MWANVPYNVEVHPPAETDDEQRAGSTKPVSEAIDGVWRVGCNGGYTGLFLPYGYTLFASSLFAAPPPERLFFSG